MKNPKTCLGDKASCRTPCGIEINFAEIESHPSTKAAAGNRGDGTSTIRTSMIRS